MDPISYPADGRVNNSSASRARRKFNSAKKSHARGRYLCNLPPVGWRRESLSDAEGSGRGLGWDHRCNCGDWSPFWPLFAEPRKYRNRFLWGMWRRDLRPLFRLKQQARPRPVRDGTRVGATTAVLILQLQRITSNAKAMPLTKSSGSRVIASAIAAKASLISTR